MRRMFGGGAFAFCVIDEPTSGLNLHLSVVSRIGAGGPVDCEASVDVCARQ